MVIGLDASSAAVERFRAILTLQRPADARIWIGADIIAGGGPFMGGGLKAASVSETAMVSEIQ
jgi:hypothetical protein